MKLLNFPSDYHPQEKMFSVGNATPKNAKMLSGWRTRINSKNLEEKAL